MSTSINSKKASQLLRLFFLDCCPFSVYHWENSVGLIDDDYSYLSFG